MGASISAVELGGILMVVSDGSIPDRGSGGGDTSNSDDIGSGGDGIYVSGDEYDVSGDGGGVDMVRNLSTSATDKNGIASSSEDSSSYYNIISILDIRLGSLRIPLNLPDLSGSDFVIPCAIRDGGFEGAIGIAEVHALVIRAGPSSRAGPAAAWPSLQPTGPQASGSPTPPCRTK
ncbi:hypothetical protein Tco_1152995 [Tanacetum coccineum]